MSLLITFIFRVYIRLSWRLYVRNIIIIEYNHRGFGRWSEKDEARQSRWPSCNFLLELYCSLAVYFHIHCLISQWEQSYLFRAVCPTEGCGVWGSRQVKLRLGRAWKWFRMEIIKNWCWIVDYGPFIVVYYHPYWDYFYLFVYLHINQRRFW